MHIVIGLITALGGLLWVLYRLQASGVDLNAFNPFYWARRRSWEKKLGTKALHQVENSMEAAAILVVAVAKLEGEITRESKGEINDLFISTFHVDDSRAKELFGGAVYLLKDVMDAQAEIKSILAPSLTAWTDAQRKTVVEMVNKVALCEGGASPAQQLFIEELKKQLAFVPSVNSQWS